MRGAVPWRRGGDSLFGSLHHYRRAWLGSDTVAGVTVTTDRRLRRSLARSPFLRRGVTGRRPAS